MLYILILSCHFQKKYLLLLILRLYLLVKHLSIQSNRLYKENIEELSTKMGDKEIEDTINKLENLTKTIKESNYSRVLFEVKAYEYLFVYKC